MPSPFVTRAQAHANPLHHQFITGMGYLAHGMPPELPATARGEKNCAPAAGVAEGSAHLLRPPGAEPMTLLWSAEHRAWSHPVRGKGNRLAWTPEHLSKAGWEYVSPVKRKAR